MKQASQGVQVVLHRYLVDPLQVLIQASCGIIDISACPADELDVLLIASLVLLAVFRAEIAGEHYYPVCVENMTFLAPSCLPTLETDFWWHMFKLPVVF